MATPLYPPEPSPVVESGSRLVTRPWLIFFQGLLNQAAAGLTSISLIGDVLGSGGPTIITTLANSGVTPGTYGDASNIPQVTFDSKGRATAAVNVPILAAQQYMPVVIGGLVVTSGSEIVATLWEAPSA